MTTKSQIIRDFAMQHGIPVIELSSKGPSIQDVYDVSPFEIKPLRVRYRSSKRDVAHYRALKNATLLAICKRLTLRKLSYLVNIARTLAEV